MNTAPRCPICDMRILWVAYSQGRDQALTMAIDMGHKRGVDAVKATLCDAHLRDWDSNLVNGTTAIVAMIQKEAELAREGT